MGEEPGDAVNDVIDSKLQIFSEKFGSDFVSFEKDKFPKLLNNDSDCALFFLLNAAFKLRGNLMGFYRMVEPYVELDPAKGVLGFEGVKANELLKDAVRKKIFTGLSLFELVPKGAAGLGSVLSEMGGSFGSFNIGTAPLSLKNYKDFAKGKFDLTFSTWLLHDTSGIDDGLHSNVRRSMEMYSIFANLTKLNGYSIHAFGSYVSTLYETFLDFTGLRVVKYLRVSSSPYGFLVVLKKYNDKEMSYEEFEYIYKMLQSRNPIRYR